MLHGLVAAVAPVSVDLQQLGRPSFEAKPQFTLAVVPRSPRIVVTITSTGLFVPDVLLLP